MLRLGVRLWHVPPPRSRCRTAQPYSKGINTGLYQRPGGSLGRMLGSMSCQKIPGAFFLPLVNNAGVLEAWRGEDRAGCVRRPLRERRGGPVL